MMLEEKIMEINSNNQKESSKLISKELLIEELYKVVSSDLSIEEIIYFEKIIEGLPFICIPKELPLECAEYSNEASFIEGWNSCLKKLNIVKDNNNHEEG